jgi:AcrR family transcriptional regulator
MQVKKEKLRENILATARAEFSEHGFSGTTMRSIAGKVPITASNIYNYFDSKDDLLQEILRPTISKIRSFLNNLRDADTDGGGFKMNEYSALKQWVDQAIRFIHSHRQDLDLILFKSHGSTIEGFKEDFIETLTNLLLRENTPSHSGGPEGSPPMSRFFLHNLCSLYTNIVAEIIMHDVPYKKMKQYAEEFTTFMFYGAKALVG